MIDFDLESMQSKKSIVSIKVLGVGGAGGNAVNSIIDSGCQGVDCIVANTDVQALELSKAQYKVQIGVKCTKGLGAGANPEVGKHAAEEDLDKLLDATQGADIVFITGGMGGGTGSGGLPVVARALREKGILTIAIVTKPFLFEGKRRGQIADASIEKLKKEVDIVIVIPNQKLLDVVDINVSMIDAFAMINSVLSQSVRGISDIITRPGHINVDYADVRTIMKDSGLAVMGTGRASGQDRAQEATLEAISSPLLENMSIIGAHGVLFNITGGKDLGLHEISQAASIIYEQAHENANIIVGSVIDENMHDEVVVTIIATNIDKSQACKNNEESRGYEGMSIVEKGHAAVEMQNESIEGQSVAQEQIFAAENGLKVEKKEELNKKSVRDVSHDAHVLSSQDLDVPTFMRRDSLHQ